MEQHQAEKGKGRRRKAKIFTKIGRELPWP